MIINNIGKKKKFSFLFLTLDFFFMKFLQKTVSLNISNNTRQENVKFSQQA